MMDLRIYNSILKFKNLNIEEEIQVILCFSICNILLSNYTSMD